MNDMVSTKLDIIEENLLLPSDFVYEFKANRKYSGDFISKYLLHDNKSLLFTDYDRDKSIERINEYINEVIRLKKLFKNKCDDKINIRKIESTDREDLDNLYFCAEFPNQHINSKSIEDKSNTNSNCKIVFGVHGLCTLKMRVDDIKSCTYLTGSIYVQTFESIESIPFSVDLLNYNLPLDIFGCIANVIYPYIEDEIKSKDKEK